MIFITKTFEFSCAHSYDGSPQAAEEGRKFPGDILSKEVHGHNYLLEVTVKGPVDQQSGMVINLTELKRIVQERVIHVFDHRFLNWEVPPFNEKLPTSENISVEIWNLLDGYFPRGTLHRIRLYESRDFYIEYFGERD